MLSLPTTASCLIKTLCDWLYIEVFCYKVQKFISYLIFIELRSQKKRKTVLGYHVDIILASLRNFLSYRLQLIWMHFTTPISVRVYLRKISTEPLSSHLTLLCSCRLKTNLGFLCPILVSSMFFWFYTCLYSASVYDIL